MFHRSGQRACVGEVHQEQIRLEWYAIQLANRRDASQARSKRALAAGGRVL